MVRSRRSVSKEDTISLLTDSGISLSSPPAAEHHDEDEVLLPKLSQANEEEVEDIKRNGFEKEEPTENVDKKFHRSKRVRIPRKVIRVKPLAPPPAPAPSAPASILTSSSKALLPVTPAEEPPLAKKQRKVYVCLLCQKEFGGNTDLKRHVLIHSDERPFKCEQCGKSYRQAVNLKNHITTVHEGQKRFACSLCPKVFALKERLRLHMRLHSGEKPYACDLCSKRFARGGQLQQHKVTHHESGTKQFICEKCSAGFSTPANLRAHMERHVNEPEHFCEDCKEHFPNDQVLRAHINKVHFKLRKFDCDICKETIEGVDLATHMKTHSHNKMHICEVCNSYFTQKSQYNVHMRMHTGERPYQCRICWQTFAHSSVLKLHIRKHTGEKPFSCLLCKDVAFSQLAHLKTHMKKIHKQNNPYMCEGCNEFFKVKIDLQAHMQNCGRCQTSMEQQNAQNSDMQTLSHLRFLIAMLLKKISTKDNLKQLGYEKRLIDNVVVASLKLANRKAYDDQKLSAIERMRLNTEELLNWIVPSKVMQNFRREKLTIDGILDKIVSMKNDDYAKLLSSLGD